MHYDHVSFYTVFSDNIAAKVYTLTLIADNLVATSLP